MWFLLWFVLSVILVGATLWSLKILLTQKKAWETYAKSKNFTYQPGTFMGPAEMSGVIGDYKLGFFTGERQGADVRTRRYVTVVEIILVEGLVNGAVMGTQEMLPFMQSLDQLHPFQVEGPGWEAGLFAFIKNDEAVKAYLTPERIEVLSSILKTRNADAVIVFHDKELVVRLETSEPMQNAEKIDKIATRVMGLCDKLRITPEQRKEYAALVSA